MVSVLFWVVVQMGIGSIPVKHLILQLEWLILRKLVLATRISSRFNSIIVFLSFF